MSLLGETRTHTSMQKISHTKSLDKQKRRSRVKARGKHPMEFLPSTTSHTRYRYVLILRSNKNLKAISFPCFAEVITLRLQILRLEQDHVSIAQHPDTQSFGPDVLKWESSNTWDRGDRASVQRPTCLPKTTTHHFMYTRRDLHAQEKNLWGNCDKVHENLLN